MKRYIYRCRSCNHVWEMPNRVYSQGDGWACNMMLEDRRCMGNVRRDYRAESVNIDRSSLG